MRGEAVAQSLPESVLARGDAVEAELVDEAHGLGEPDRLRDARRARLEALRARQVLGLLDRDRGDHRAAVEERRQGVEHLGAAVEHADAGGAVELVPAEDGEVDVELARVEGHVRRGLAGVEHDECADRAGEGHELGERAHLSGDVGDVAEREHARALADDAAGDLDVEGAVVAHGDVPQGRTGAGGELLPRDEVRVVLELGRDDLVAGPQGVWRGGSATHAEARVAERVGDEVERLGRVAREHDLVLVDLQEAGDW